MFGMSKRGRKRTGIESYQTDLEPIEGGYTSGQKRAATGLTAAFAFSSILALTGCGKDPKVYDLRKSPTSPNTEAVVTDASKATTTQSNQAYDWIDPKNYSGDNVTVEYIINEMKKGRAESEREGYDLKPIPRFRITDIKDATSEILNSWGLPSDKKSLKQKFPGYQSAEMVTVKFEHDGYADSLLVIYTKTGSVFLDEPIF